MTPFQWMMLPVWMWLVTNLVLWVVILGSSFLSRDPKEKNTTPKPHEKEMS